MRQVIGVTFLVSLAAGTAGAQPVGEPGESCRARSDCREGLRCIANVCHQLAGRACSKDIDCGAGRVCRDSRCAALPAAKPGTAASGKAWSDFELQGTHLIGGITISPGMTGFWNYGGPVEVDPAFFFALRLGVLFERTELALEIAPKTWVWDFESDRSSFSLNVSIGRLLQLSERAYWPLRFGLGFTAGDLPIKDVYLQGRLDLIGVVYQYGHLLFEVHLPSIRFHSELRNVGIWAWLFNISVTYVM